MATAKKAPAKKTAAKKSSTAAKKKGSAASKKSSGAAKKSSAAAKKTARARPDATTLLMKDHREVKGLFRRYEKLVKSEAEGRERQQLAEEICQMLAVHAQIEEEIFYPAVREANVDEDLVDEAEVEHASAKDLIGQIQGMQPDDDLYDAKVTVLGEYVNHHVEEEESQMFPKARRAKVDMEGLLGQLKERRTALMGQGGGAMMGGATETGPGPMQ